MAVKMSASTLLGLPMPFKRICIVYPPSVTKVIGTAMYPSYLSVFTQSQEDIWDSLAENEGDIPTDAPTPFAMLLKNCESSPQVQKITEDAFEFFTKEKVSVRVDGGLVFFMSSLENAKGLEDLRYIDESNFFEFQNLIRVSVGEPAKAPPEIEENPRIAVMKAKARKRDRIKKAKGSSSSISLSAMLVALSCMEVDFTLLNQSGEISYCAIEPLFEMARAREKYQTDIRLIAGGADSKKIKPKDYLKEN